MRDIDQDKIFESCAAARKSLIPESMRVFVPPVQSSLQTAIATYATIFEDAAKGHLLNRELLHEAVNQVMEHTTPAMARAMQHAYPMEWQGFLDLKPAACQF